MRNYGWLGAFGLVACLAAGSQDVSAQEGCTPIVGRMASIEGQVDVQREGSDRWQPAVLDQDLCQGDSVRAEELSRAAIALINDAVLRVDERTTLRLIDIVEEEEGTSFLQLVQGIFQSFSRSPRRLAIDTPYMNATIEGTEFVLAVADDQAAVTVLEGVVAVENDQGAARVASGEAAVAEAGQAPRQVTVVTPRDAVQWSLYYPPILAVRATPGSGLDPAASPTLQRALDLAAEGRTAAALEALDEVPAAERGSTWHVYRASLLLSAGRVEEAEAAIDRALAADPENGTAYALRAIVEVVQNEGDAALASARRGVEASPEASAPKVALSYALQANFDLEAARDVLLEAIRQDPDNPLLWARLAELQLSLGERRAAREAAERAVQLSEAGASTTTTEGPGLTITLAAFAPDRGGEPAGAAPDRPFVLAQAPAATAPATPTRSPELERALVVLGFANLTEFDTTEARENFSRAIALDPADPLPHFGLGLAQIRDGELEAGRQNIEVAVALDSNSSVLRSYLGKAYFEEKRDELAADQFEIAKELDPRDPTPYLYDAIRKQTEGRPVEALQDLQTSIELNDNRAVYRSRLQLDEDRAARGTSIARIYDDLGFQELGLKEASKSLAVDPTNASAHRFLSDIYGGVRRRESARVSELLQAQMLQNININPIQPSASETNLNIVTTGGPAEVGFNEFTPLFEREQFQVNASALAGDEDTYGGEAVASALYDRFSISAGAFHYETNGWRENHEIEHDIYNVFFQAAITPELNAQIELRKRESDLGDLALNFDPDIFFPNFDRSNERDIGRAGIRYAPTPDSNFLLSFIYTDNTDQVTDLIETPDAPIGVTGDLEDKGYQLEAQYLWTRDRLDLIVGAAFSDFDLETDILITAGDDVLQEFSDPEDLTQFHPYVYGNLNFPDPVVWTVGLSYDEVERDFENAGSFKVDEVNPKFGVQWSLTDDLLLRGTALKFVKPFLAADRSLEPTQVAGFNQLYDDRNFVPSWRYGVGLDWQARNDLFLGLEANWRDLEIPFVTTDSPTEFSDWKEQTYGAYLNWTPFSELALSVGLTYDRFKADDSVFTIEGEVPQELDTLSLPVQARYFHPSGFFAGAGVTLVHQDVDRNDANILGLAAAQGSDEFVVVDLSAGYRLPRRLGVVTLEVANLLDQDFLFQDDSFREFQDRPSIGPYIPDRQIVGRLTLNW